MMGMAALQYPLAEKALRYLNAEPLLHMSMIFPIRRGTAEVLHAAAEGVFLHETQSDAYMLSATDFETGKPWLDGVGRHPLVCVHQRCFADYLNRKYGYAMQLDCFQAVYTKKNLLPIDAGSGLEIRALQPKAAQEVYQHYHDNADLDYICGRIMAGELFGGFEGDKLCGFIGTHTEGSIGLLHILPDCRRRGFARKMESFMVNRALNAGRVPFSQISLDNEQSLALHRSLGFELSNKVLHWLF